MNEKSLLTMLSNSILCPLKPLHSSFDDKEKLFQFAPQRTFLCLWDANWVQTRHQRDVKCINISLFIACKLIWCDVLSAAVNVPTRAKRAGEKSFCTAAFCWAAWSIIKLIDVDAVGKRFWCVQIVGWPWFYCGNSSVLHSSVLNREFSFIRTNVKAK